MWKAQEEVAQITNLSSGGGSLWGSHWLGYSLFLARAPVRQGNGEVAAAHWQLPGKSVAVVVGQYVAGASP